MQKFISPCNDWVIFTVMHNKKESQGGREMGGGGGRGVGVEDINIQLGLELGLELGLS